MPYKYMRNEDLHVNYRKDAEFVSANIIIKCNLETFKVDFIRRNKMN